MKVGEVLRGLAEVTASQWGMVTTAQASVLGITRLTLSRLAEAGHLERLAHGVYRDAGAPGSEFDDLRAAWLSTEPKLFAEERVGSAANGVVVASTSAAFLQGVGDSWAGRHQFVAPVRRQSQREDLRFRQRVLAAQDVTLVQGLPVMRIERTLADLLEDLGDQSLAAGAMSDAMKKYSIDLDRLSELLGPLAERNGLKKNDGVALLGKVTESAGLDLGSFAHRIAANPALGARVAADYLQKLLSVEHDVMLRNLMADTKLMPAMESFGFTKSVSDVVNMQAFANLSQHWTKNMTFPSLLEGEVNDEAE